MTYLNVGPCKYPRYQKVKMSTYLTAVKNELVRIKTFTFVDGASKSRNVTLLEDLSVQDSKNVLLKWEVLDSKIPGIALLRLYSAGDVLVVTLRVSPEGVWQGRNRLTNGTSQLLGYPINVPLNWRNLADSAAFFRMAVREPKDPSFTYREHLGRQKVWTTEDSWDILQSGNLHSLHRNEGPKSEAIILIGYNRPEYFEKVVQSIAQNPESQKLPVFVFLDKCENTVFTDTMTQTAKEAFNHAYVVRRATNYGCGRNIIDARHQIFTNLGFQRAWVFEDDLVISKDYMAFCTNLMAWADSKYGNVGAVQGWSFCDKDVDWKVNHLDLVDTTYENWWGYLMKKSAWDTMSEFMLQFRDLFLSGLYSERPHKSIVEHFRKYRKDLPNTVTLREKVPESGKALRERRKYFDNPPSGQDAATMLSFHQTGWQRLAPKVNRGMYIGKQGIHMNESLWKSMKFEDCVLHEFSADSDRSTFSFTSERIQSVLGT